MLEVLSLLRGHFKTFKLVHFEIIIKLYLRLGLISLS